MNYYIMRNNQTYGPYSEEIVKKYVAEGTMLGTDQGRTEGMSNWVPLSQLLAKDAAPQTPPAYVAPHVPESKPEYVASTPSYTPPYTPPKVSGGTSKKQYLDSIRSDSAYPTYRGFINVIAILGYILAGIVALGALGGGVFTLNKSPGSGMAVIVGGLIYAAILFLMARFFKEAALILADIGDSTVDANSRNRT